MHIIETLAPAQVACARILPTQLPRPAEGGPVIHNRYGDGTFQLAPVEPAIESADIAAEIIGQQFRRDEHGSAQRIAAKQRSLRHFQNLDARNSEIGSSGGQCGHGHVGKIGDHARRTLTHRNLTNAAQRHNVIVLRSFVTEAKSGNYRWRSEEHTSELPSLM